MPPLLRSRHPSNQLPDSRVRSLASLLPCLLVCVFRCSRGRLSSKGEQEIRFSSSFFSFLPLFSFTLSPAVDGVTKEGLLNRICDPFPLDCQQQRQQQQERERHRHIREQR